MLCMALSAGSGRRKHLIAVVEGPWSRCREAALSCGRLLQTSGSSSTYDGILLLYRRYVWSKSCSSTGRTMLQEVCLASPLRAT